ncbi:MAG TPA: isopentenyl phosphate kinase [Thermoplasmata archaeon]|nr:isopentenyl phosphate kinase [Thermoplasmata archaeon]
MLLVKLGGSVLTDKTRLRTPRKSAIARLTKELTGLGDDLVVVHGAGSFGHMLARKYALNGPAARTKARGASVVQRDVRTLDGFVVDGLMKAGLAPVVLPPSAILGLDEGRVASFDVEPFREYVHEGFTPVTFGDVVRDRTRGVAVCSGDVVMLELARAFHPRCAVFAADVDGLFTADPKDSKDARLLLSVSETELPLIDFGPAKGADVTGGMEAKVHRMLEIASHADETLIVNGNVKNRVRDALRGRIVVGTRVVGGR